MTHTPGPWTIQRVDTGALIHGNGGRYVADVHAHTHDEDRCGESQVDADARLIAAAPFMLEMIRRASEHLQSRDRLRAGKALACLLRAEVRAE